MAILFIIFIISLFIFFGIFGDFVEVKYAQTEQAITEKIEEEEHKREANRVYGLRGGFDG